MLSAAPPGAACALSPGWAFSPFSFCFLRRVFHDSEREIFEPTAAAAAADEPRRRPNEEVTERSVLPSSAGAATAGGGTVGGASMEV